MTVWSAPSVVEINRREGSNENTMEDHSMHGVDNQGDNEDIHDQEGLDQTMDDIPTVSHLGGIDDGVVMEAHADKESDEEVRRERSNENVMGDHLILGVDKQCNNKDTHDKNGFHQTTHYVPGVSHPGGIDDGVVMEARAVLARDKERDEHVRDNGPPQQATNCIVTVPYLGRINNSDFIVLEDILPSTIQEENIEIRKNDKERRVYKLDLRYSSIESELDSLPHSIGRLVYLEDLNLTFNRKLLELPEEIGSLIRLQKLSLGSSGIKSLPSSIGKLQNLEDLDLGGTRNLISVPDGISHLIRLKNLTFGSSNIKWLPPSIGQLQNLEDLDLKGTKNLSTIPEEIGDLSVLKKLSFYSSSINMLPSSIGKLQHLEELHLGRTRNLFAVPEEFGNLTRLRKLNLSGSGIRSFPPSIGHLHNLEELDLSGTKNLFDFPEEIGNLTKLKKLSAISCPFDSLAPSIGQLQNLETFFLDLTLNLFEVPEEIGMMASLKQLSFNGSGIELLPDSIGKLQNLEDLDLGETRDLDEVPEEIGNLMKLKKFNFRDSGIESLPPIAIHKLGFARGRQRAMSRTGFGISDYNDKPNKQINPILWPSLLNRAIAAFLPSASLAEEDCLTMYLLQNYNMSEPEAIYQLLLDGRESFCQLIVAYSRNIV